MKKTLLCLGVAVIVAVSATAFGQTGKADRSGGWMSGSPYTATYNPNSMVTVSGRVNGIQRMQPIAGMDDGVVLLVKAKNGGTAMVDVGPTWFVDNQPIKIKLGDQVTITGSKTIVNKRGTILARTITKGHDLLVLRRTNGEPIWWAYQTYPNGVPLDQFGNLVAYNGTVQSVNTVTVGGVTTDDLVLSTANGTVNIDLGPQWFLDRQGMVFDVGSNITVFTGPATTQVGNVTMFPAFDVVNNNALLNLRFMNGMPVWNGWNIPPSLVGGR